jgi:DNA-binding FadR family transcriptional regulator
VGLKRIENEEVHERWPVRPIKGDITAKLISLIKGLISKGVLVPGCKPPPERELAQWFRVNRSSLR